MGKAAQNAAGQPGPRKYKVHSLTGRIDSELLRSAFDQVKRNKGASGIDRVSITAFKRNLEANLTRLRKDLKDRTYRPKPLRRVYIRKPNGKIRPLGIPVIRDRTAQEVIRRLLEPIFEPIFHDNSFGFRPGRGCHDALERIKAYRAEGYQWVVDADIVGCFDNIPQKVIMQTLSWEVADGNILTMVERFLKAGVVEDGELKATTKGTPQGGPFSPLIANIVLNRMDWQLALAGYLFVRYADDFVILCRSKHKAEEAYAFVREVLAELGLKLSEEKTHITNFREGFDFLGFHLSQSHLTMKDGAVERFKTKVKNITVRSHNLDRSVLVTASDGMDRLNALTRGTANYFGWPSASTRRQFLRLDQFVRKRIRCMKKKRIWRTDNYRLPNKLLKRWGLLSLAESARR
jgi:group II intron reverse transcriptase/maturase